MKQEHRDYKRKLMEELALLEKELESVGRKNPENPLDWEAVQTDKDIDVADITELGDSMNEFEGNAAILKQLEIRYNEVKDGLERIEKETYGLCRICQKPIEEERLDIHPSASTCIAHKEQ